MFQLSLFLLSCKKDLLKQISVTTGIFTDSRDGKVYTTTTIGNYTWLAQNLVFATDSGSCYYNNDSITNNDYGRLYNWVAAQKAIPQGWHLPTFDELNFLYMNLGSYELGCQMKETGNSHWIGDNSNANNYTKLTIIPGGYYSATSNQFSRLGNYAFFWQEKQSSWSVTNDNYVYYSYFNYGYSTEPAKDMYSVRCVKDY